MKKYAIYMLAALVLVGLTFIGDISRTKNIENSAPAPEKLIPASTPGTVDEVVYPTDEDMDAIKERLKVLERDKKQYGLEGVPFEELSIGSRIHSYSFVNGEFRKGGVSYPILYGGKMVAWANYDMNRNVVVSTNFANAIYEYSGKDVTKIAIVSDSHYNYVFDVDTFLRLNQYCVAWDDKDSIFVDGALDGVDTSHILLCDLSVSKPLGYVS